MDAIVSSGSGPHAAGVVLPIMVSEAMRTVVSCAADVAETDATVLLLGENGTGKEVIARYIHELSLRAGGPWVVLNCAALPQEALHSELFGHDEGAFLRTSTAFLGRIEQANGGTLLLDEVSELPMPVQAKLLRVLQERHIDRAGGHAAVPVDLRVIATCNRDLRAEVVAGRFRADLYYRLCVFPIVVPPLRDRRADIEALARHFVERLARDLGRQAPVLSASALLTLHGHTYGGNVRELRNLIERTLIRCRHPVLEAADLYFDPSLPAAPSAPNARPQNEYGDAGKAAWTFPVDLGELESMAISEALRRVGGNRTHAARLLGISLRTLRNKLKAWRENGEVTGLMVGDSGPVTRHERDSDMARSSQEHSNEQAA